MANKYLDLSGVEYLWSKIKGAFALKSHKHTKSDITDFPTIPSIDNCIQQGGTLTANLRLPANDTAGISNSDGSKAIVSFSSDGNTFRIGSTSYPTLVRTSSNVSIESSGSTDTPLQVTSKNGNNQVWIGFRNSNVGKSSYIGVSSDSKPLFNSGSDVPLLMGDKSYKIVTSSSAPTSADANTITLVI